MTAPTLPVATDLPPDAVRACCVAGDADTNYYRAGRGEPVIILSADCDTARTLLTQLPRRFQGVIPKPRIHRDFSQWMRDFLDALGLPTVSIIADSAFAPDAVYFALHEPDRVRRIVFLAANGQPLVAAWGEESAGDHQPLPEIAGYFGD